jgi:formylglycine-generating enzyme required for sulfatase activity/serine/threonine protein kinase
MSSEADPLGLVGTTIAEKYAVESVVGEGGFAIVYRAMHSVWKRPVAVKVFKALGEVAPSERQKLLDDFIQEGRLLADLSERSSAICQARDVGMMKTPRGDQVPYMVLEWLEGKPLETVLAEERAAGMPLRSLEATVRLLDPVADALALAHKKGIAHRDVKPANVFVLGNARGEEIGIKLLDFGIAKVVQDAQKMGFGKTAGHITSFTPSYGAPEQFNRAYGATGPWTDVFALALVAVEILTGEPPLVGDSLVQLAYASADPGRRPVPRTFGVVTTDEVDAVFRKACAVQTAERYQTVGEFWNALRMAVIGHPMAAISTARGVRTLELIGESQTIASPNSSAFGATTPLAGTMGPGSMSTTGPSMPSAAPAGTLQSAQSPGRSKVPILAGIAAVAVLGTGIVAGVALRSKTGPGAGTKSDAPVASSAMGAGSTTSASSAPSVGSAVRPSGATCPPGMKRIDGGEYFMGSDEKDADANERPPHKVKLGAYCLDEFEVTTAKYKACSDRGACLRAGKENEWDGITANQRKIYDPLCNATKATDRAQHPINCVDWDQATKYCEAMEARLPTEAEWEFAARGSDGRIYPWGDDAPSAQLLNACGTECVGWMKKNPDPDQPPLAMYQEDDGYPATAPVGKFPKGKSSWGIQDIVGNVWEWVADWHAPYDPASASTMAVDPKGPPSGTMKVIRGGAWNGAKPAWVRPAWRFQVDPKMRTHGIGFRCAKSV